MMKSLVKGCLLIVLFVSVGIASYMIIRECLNSYNDEIEFDLKNSMYTETMDDYIEHSKNDSLEQLDNKQVTVSDVVDNVLPSIVSITAKTTYVTEDLFFGNYETESVQAGSGIIISHNSQEVLIATNNHVVENNAEITVTFFDDSIVYGKLKGADESTDLAVICVNKEDISINTFEAIKVASLGDADKLRVGESVIAVGNAMGYGNSVTTGIISAKDREIDITDAGNMKLLQTDAAINPGNSGGALINLRGEVIGINSIKYVSANTEKVGYAIPINTAVPILNELINYEEVNEADRGYLGITGRDITDIFAIRYGAPYGVYIYEMDDKSPAKEAGLITGDIITSFNGKKVTSMDEISNMLKYKRAGDICKVKIRRLEQGEYVEYNFEVELTAQP